MERLFIHPSFVIPPEVTQEEALIGRVDHHGVVGQASLVKIVQKPSKIVIYRNNRRQIILDISLIDPAQQLLSFQIQLLKLSIIGIIYLIPRSEEDTSE